MHSLAWWWLCSRCEPPVGVLLPLDSLDSRSCAACAALRHATACLTTCALSAGAISSPKVAAAAGTFQPPRAQRAARRAVCPIGVSQARAEYFHATATRARSRARPRHCRLTSQGTVAPPRWSWHVGELRGVGQQRVRIYRALCP